MSAPERTDVAPEAVLELLISRFRAHTETISVVQACAWTSTFQIHRRLASSYRRDRVFLAWSPRPRPGDRVADIAGTRDDGRPTRLHAELGARWVVVAPATRRGEACAAAARRTLGPDGLTRIMPAQQAHRLLLVRPDAHLAWAGRNPAALTRRLARVLWNA